MQQQKFLIAQLGRTVGLYGDLKLHLHTDFPQQFKKGVTLRSNRGELTVTAYDPSRNLIRFEGYESLESAKKLTNARIYSDEATTRALCPLEKGEHYWFDILGSELFDGEEKLGEVRQIQRMLDTDYLLIATDKRLQEAGLAENFLVPYIPRYILSVDEGRRRIETQETREILEAS